MSTTTVSLSDSTLSLVDALLNKPPLNVSEGCVNNARRAWDRMMALFVTSYQDEVDGGVVNVFYMDADTGYSLGDFMSRCSTEAKHSGDRTTQALCLVAQYLFNRKAQEAARC